jgi:signal transduction histidine kinase
VDVVEEAIQSCHAATQAKNVAVVNKLQRFCGVVPMDRGRLVRVFQNVLLNAIQHSPSGAIVTVAAQRRRDGCQPWIDCVITDDGPGIPGELLSRVFQPFYSRRTGGTGLGLSIVQQIVEEHRAKVSVGNRPEGGAVVRLAFPLAAAADPTREGA